ncbi:MAG: extracellular solute-binding protein [Clostridia bacterium]|nr:extracellular solute-binding protein [Clostridia bacterium]
MKKLVSLLLVLMLAACIVPSFAEEDEYPEIVEGIDFGGATLYINPYWAEPDRVENPDEDVQAMYDFRDWIMKAYHVNIVYEQLGGWGDSQVEEIRNIIDQKDSNTYRVILMPMGFVGSPMANSWFADWADNDLIDLSDTKYNAGITDFMTKGDSVYGVTYGVEPRACLFFNKKILKDADIDYNEIYDLQKNGEWTWDKLEEYCKKLQKDEDADGVPEVYGITGNINDLYMCAVFSNGGSFFDFNDEGKLAITAGSENTIEALSWVAQLWQNYGRAQAWPEEDWDYFINVFKSGNAAFCVHQTYGGYNDPPCDFSDMQDDWGCVMIPKGPKGEDYKFMVSENIGIIPNIYDKETKDKIQFIWDLYNSTAPGVDEETAWIGNKYTNTRGDTRAVDETYALMREPKSGAADKSLYLGDNNTVLGSSTGVNYLWGVLWGNPQELLEGITPFWNSLLDTFNNPAQ